MHRRALEEQRGRADSGDHQAFFHCRGHSSAVGISASGGRSASLLTHHPNDGIDIGSGRQNNSRTEPIAHLQALS
jgi:hypothetical protein